MYGSKHFVALLEKMNKVHQEKNHDYAQAGSPFSNFERAAIIVSWFNNPIDQVFAGLIGIKIARLAELCNGKMPKNESIDDNGLDLANYAGLWQAFREYNRESNHLKNIVDEGLNKPSPMYTHVAKADEMNKVGPSGGQIFQHPNGPTYEER